MVYIEKTGDNSTRLNFTNAIIQNKTVPESNVSLNRTDGGTFIAIEQGVKVSRAIIRAIVPRESGGAYDYPHAIGNECTHPRLVLFMDDEINWGTEDVTVYISNPETGAAGVTARCVTQSLPKEEEGAFFYNLTLEFEYIRSS